MNGPVDDVPDPRGAARSNVFLTGTLETSDGPLPVRIRNVSERGALLEGPNLPEQFAQVVLHRGHLSATAEVAWRSPHQCGVRFDDAILVSAWVKRVGHTGQEQVDRAVASFRQSRHLEPAANELDEAGDLRTISAALDSICERLSSAPYLSVELAEEVLRLDAIAHSLRRLAG